MKSTKTHEATQNREALDALAARILSADEQLKKIARNMPMHCVEDINRLEHKSEGVRLAYGYLLETMQDLELRGLA